MITKRHKRRVFCIHELQHIFAVFEMNWASIHIHSPHSIHPIECNENAVFEIFYCKFLSNLKCRYSFAFFLLSNLYYYSNHNFIEISIKIVWILLQYSALNCPKNVSWYVFELDRTKDTIFKTMKQHKQFHLVSFSALTWEWWTFSTFYIHFNWRSMNFYGKVPFWKVQFSLYCRCSFLLCKWNMRGTIATIIEDRTIWMSFLFHVFHLFYCWSCDCSVTSLEHIFPIHILWSFLCQHFIHRMS